MPQKIPNNANILGTFASILGVLGVFLYFTGWVYRLAYFDFFQLKITHLGFPVESFFFIPMQVFFRDSMRSLLTFLLFIITTFLIRFILWLINPLPVPKTYTITTKYPKPSLLKRLTWLVKPSVIPNHKIIIAKPRKLSKRETLHQIQPLPLIRAFFSLFSAQIRNDFIIVTSILLILNSYARFYGDYDAHLAATDSTSTLPIVTLIAPNTLGLGRNPSDIFTDPTLQDKYRIFGDKALFDSIKGAEINEQKRVWRFLIQSNGWIYIFPGLSSDQAKNNEGLPVVGIRESTYSDQIIILSPTSPQKNN